MKGTQKNKNIKKQFNETKKMKIKKYSIRKQKQKGGKMRKKTRNIRKQTKHSAFKRSIFFPFFRE
jgi:hypothetical protein